MSALLGTSFCLCTIDDACGSAHCDCVDADVASDCTSPDADECTDITINSLDAVADLSTLHLIELPALLPPPLLAQVESLTVYQLAGVIPTATAPPRPPSRYLLTAHRLYPRS